MQEMNQAATNQTTSTAVIANDHILFINNKQATEEEFNRIMRKPARKPLRAPGNLNSTRTFSLLR